MSENINLRPISELPEVESVSEGDKLLLNSDGEAKLIDASKVGGSGGGGGTVYFQVMSMAEDFSTGAVMCYADEALTQPLTYAEGKELLTGGAGLCGSITMEGMSIFASINFSLIAWDMPYEKGGYGIVMSPAGTAGMIILGFSDTQITD